MDQSGQATHNGVEALRVAVATGHELDLGGAEIAADSLVAVLTSKRPPGAPVLRLRRARISGQLRLVGAVVELPVELLDCEFDTVPDLRMVRLESLALTGTRLPGLRAGNLRVAADLLLDDGFVADGTVHLTDAQIGGSLRLSGGWMRGANGRSLIADRIVVNGACYARRLRSDGELRLPGAKIAGNLDLGGAELRTPFRDALDATGAQVGGSVFVGRHRERPELAFSARGRVLLTGARIGGDLVFSGALIEARTPDHREDADPAAEESRVPSVPTGIVDEGACLVADRVRVEGNLQLDDGARTTGTVRLPNAVVGGYLRLSGAQLTGAHGGAGASIALLGDGMDIGGDLECRDSGRGPLVCRGQLRLVDAHVRGSASMSGVVFVAPEAHALLADRLRIGGEFYLRMIQAEGTIRLQNAEIGAALDCAQARMRRPRLRPDGTARPSLDLRAAHVGRDIILNRSVATGGVRLRHARAGKSVQITDALLGGSPAPASNRYALNAHGLETPELVIRPAAPPAGMVRLSQARVGTFTDSSVLWDATDGIQLDAFDYLWLNDIRVIDVRQRLRWLERVLPDYAPGPYEQLAAAYRRAGDEELSDKVMMARQRREYAEAGLAGRMWGALQYWTVGFGYRPWLAACWLLLFWALGGIWFATHEPPPVDEGQNPVFNPWIYSADTLLPIVNLGQDGYWRLEGASQWIASTLVIVGWILATTAATGAARILKKS